jgi:hypothetical protein
VPVLVAAKLLRPLGNPPQNSVKFYAALESLEQAKDRTWLANVTNALNQHWQTQNAANYLCHGMTRGAYCRLSVLRENASKRLPSGC